MDDPKRKYLSKEFKDWLYTNAGKVSALQPKKPGNGITPSRRSSPG